MAVLGVQLVFSMVMASALSKLSSQFSFGRWLLCRGLFRFLHPTDEELKKLAGVPRRLKNHGSKDNKKGKDDVFTISKSVDIVLETAPITPVDILPLRFYTDYQWLMDFTVCAVVVYLVTELYYAVFPVQDFNLSIVWCLLVMCFVLKVLFSITSIYFQAEDSGERILCFVFGFFFLVLAMGILIIDENTLDFGLVTGYHNFSSGAKQFLDQQGLDSAGPASLLTLRVSLAFVCSILGSLLTFPGLRLAKMHTDALKYAKENPLKQTLLHLNIISPLFILVLWVRPITREYMVEREFTPGRYLMTEENFETSRAVAIILFCLLRFSLCRTHLQAYLNVAYDNVQKLKKEAGRISSLELQKIVVRVYYYLCVVALQYFAPLIMLMVFSFLLKTLGNMSVSSLMHVQIPSFGASSKAALPKDAKLLSEDAETFTEAAAQLSMALGGLRQVFTPLWYRGLFSFLSWWVILAWFITSSFGLLYHQYFV